MNLLGNVSLRSVIARQASLPDLNYSRGRKLAAHCRAEWMICMPLGHMAESAA